MSSIHKERRAARGLALDVLYQAEIRDQLPLDALSSQGEGGWSLPSDNEHEGVAPAPNILSYARRLVEGVQENAAEIDQMIARCADRWALDRMPVVDRSLLRLGLFELIWMPDVPVAVVINEAVELAKILSTEDSGRFINGVLGRVAAEKAAPQ